MFRRRRPKRPVTGAGSPSESESSTKLPLTGPAVPLASADERACAAPSFLARFTCAPNCFPHEVRTSLHRTNSVWYSLDLPNGILCMQMSVAGEQAAWQAAKVRRDVPDVPNSILCVHTSIGGEWMTWQAAKVKRDFPDVPYAILCMHTAVAGEPMPGRLTKEYCDVAAPAACPGRRACAWVPAPRPAPPPPHPTPRSGPPHRSPLPHRSRSARHRSPC
jgi:hypothetical protein